jgi:hypothetical protein
VSPDCRPCWKDNFCVDQWGSTPKTTLTGDIINLTDPDGTGYDEELLASLNAKLNTLIMDEIGEDKILFEP